MFRIHDVLPPVIVDPIPAAGGFREMPEPPFVMFASIAIAPFRRGDHASGAFEIGEVFQPVVTLTQHRTSIVPVIITLAVRRKMHVAYCCPPGIFLFIADETLP